MDILDEVDELLHHRQVQMQVLVQKKAGAVKKNSVALAGSLPHRRLQS
jgi:hypothetical protein